MSDQGVGINEEDQKNMFERFFRAASSQGIPGTGIGLSLVKSLTEMHKGTIELESAEGVGSTFTIRIPLDLREINSRENSESDKSLQPVN